MKVLYRYLIYSLFALIAIPAAGQQKQGYIASLGRPNHWVDSVYRKLSKKERIAQLFFVRAHTDKGQAYEDSVGYVIKNEQVGGLVFFQGGPVRQAGLINRYQKLAKVPLLIAQDGEWGLGMRLDSTISYPYQMTLGAISDNALIYKMGQFVAYDFKRMGMQMNLAPDMDVNNNPDNPVINFRSFGDNKYNVAAKGIAYMKGMQDGGILTTAKHFPGHGDTNVDSHLDLPLLPFDRKRLDTLEEYPFRQAIKAGISGVMIAHMDIPALDSTKNLPSTLSKPIVTGNLKDSLGFKGLIVSDAMEMKGVLKYFPDGQADVRAFLAGNDIIELSENSERAIGLIKKAIRKDGVTKKEFEARVKKILAAKYWAGLNHYKDVSADHLIEDLNRGSAKALVQQLCDNAVTLLKGDGSTLQLNPLQKTAIISVGVTQPTVFQRELSQQWYLNSDMYIVGKATSADQLLDLLVKLRQYDQIFVSINDTRPRPASKLDYSNGVKLFISELASFQHSVICVFANPYTIAGLPGIEKSGALIAGYQMSDEMQRSVVKVITRLIDPKGRSPVRINQFFPSGSGVTLR
ncbi:glycoside hydrolase family 3 protein [Mucilaginibacter sp.]|jgi:beta-glucosidase-like glycosyl hydrolase|uniref:glycoside hydrolase family 3 protein n=1 Tax=Mucilaginibacter sp. TaxID=1882438 RepID=UPI002CC493E2|nr:glycoside hydrolase family 3 N-terminal domain-containing protein [Mucilaginibacter sp.]HTI59564.1 glycoside hydrolase family 3 N-terminal domain-containing protein [Mucilaginibacter sp.]